MKRCGENALIAARECIRYSEKNKLHGGFLIDTKAQAIRIAQLARDKKAQAVVVLDVRGISTFCDYFVILSGESLRQVNAFAQAVSSELSKSGVEPLSRVPAADESGWICLDYASVVVHIFSAQTREFYNLERLWSDAKKVRIPPASSARATVVRRRQAKKPRRASN